MADVDRAQLLLVTGLLLAVAMVALTLLVNTAIYTENLASRGTDAGGRDAIEFRATSVDAIGGLVDAENERDHGSYALVEGNVTTGIGEFDRVVADRYAGRGTGASLENATPHEGRLLRRTETGPLENVTGTPDWTLATGVSDTRGFVIDTTDDAALDAGPPPGDSFAVVLNGSGGGEWRLYLYNDGGPAIAVDNDTGTATLDVCSPSSTPAIDLTAGRVDGQPCSAIVFGKNISAPYSIEIENGHNVNATFGVTINDTAAPESDNFNGGPGGQPYEVPAVYSVAVDVHFERPDLLYYDRVRVAPGEAP